MYVCVESCTTHTVQLILYTTHCTPHTLLLTLYTSHTTAHTVHLTLYNSLYTSHCTAHTVLLTLYNSLYTSHCTTHTVLLTLYTSHCTTHTVLLTLYNSHCTTHTVLLTLYNSHCTTRTVHLTLCSLQLSRGADPTIADNLGKIPVDYIPDALVDSVSYSVAMEMKSTLEDALARPIQPDPSPSKSRPPSHTPSLHITFTSEHIDKEQDNKVVDKGETCCCSVGVFLLQIVRVLRWLHPIVPECSYNEW